MPINVHRGWSVEFKKNVHMYCHSLKMAKDGRRFEIPCEDSPLSLDLIAMWPYELKLSDQMLQDLIEALSAWADDSGLKYRIYRARNEYDTNEESFEEDTQPTAARDRVKKRGA